MYKWPNGGRYMECLPFGCSSLEAVSEAGLQLIKRTENELLGSGNLKGCVLDLYIQHKNINVHAMRIFSCV